MSEDKEKYYIITKERHGDVYIERIATDEYLKLLLNIDFGSLNPNKTYYQGIINGREHNNSNVDCLLKRYAIPNGYASTSVLLKGKIIVPYQEKIWTIGDE
jgi:hypothetical protein